MHLFSKKTMQCNRFLVRALPVLQLRLAFCEFGYIRLSQFEDHFLNSKNQKAKFCSSLSVRLLNKFLFLQRLFDFAAKSPNNNGYRELP